MRAVAARSGLLLLAVLCSGAIERDKLACELAASYVAECCDVRVNDMGANLCGVPGCGGEFWGASLASSTCLTNKTCDELLAEGFCDSFPSGDVWFTAGGDSFRCEP